MHPCNTTVAVDNLWASISSFSHHGIQSAKERKLIIIINSQSSTALRVVASYPPNSVLHAHFYCLEQVLKGMHSDNSSLQFHSATREMLSSLDLWVKVARYCCNCIDMAFKFVKYSPSSLLFYFFLFLPFLLPAGWKNSMLFHMR